jgi:hypothetical protein
MKLLASFLAALFAGWAVAQQPDPGQQRLPREMYSSGKISRTASQVDERKFISNGMTHSAVLSKLGEPDWRIIWVVTRIATQEQWTEPHTDVYEPAPGDDQTRTRIRYTGDNVSGVDRDVVR